MEVPKPTRTKKKKKVKKKSQRKIGKAICVLIAKKIVREKHGKCEICGKKKSDGWQMHGAHIVPVAFSHTAADTFNILCLCASCHSMGSNSMHDNPVKFVRWLDANHWGRFEMLHQQALNKEKVDWVLVYENLLIEAKQKGVTP